MTDRPTRRRAPGMSPEQRREMIVRTALPLVAEHGAAVTTSQIARAAGIGEATVFRAFADKDELLDACVREALRPDSVLAEIAAIPLDQPLAARLTEAAEAMSAHLTRMGTVLGALHASGRRSRGRGEERPPAGLDRENSFRQTREAIAELFEPERDHLRLSPEQLAAIFLSLLFPLGRRAPGDTAEPLVTLAELVEVFLRGALTGPEDAE